MATLYNFIIDEYFGGSCVNANAELQNFFEPHEYTIFDRNINDKSLIYYCLINTFGYPSFDIQNGNLKIPTDIVEKYHNGFNIKFVFWTIHESDAPEAVKTLADYADSLKIKQTDFYLSTGNQILQKQKEKFGVDINVHSNNSIPRIISISMQNIERGVKIKNSILFPTDDIPLSHKFAVDREKLFQSYNRANKYHRSALFTFFNKENLLDKVDLSYLKIGNIMFDGGIPTVFGERIVDNKISEEYFDILKKIAENNKSIKSKFENFEFDQGGPQHDLTYKNNLYKHGYINIVTETQYEWDGIEHITEKSIQPFFFYQIPIIVGTPGHVKSMKDKWGFDFFDDIINHSYDSIENHSLRFNKITREILRLSKMENEIKEFFKNNQDRFEKNKEIVKSISNCTIDKDFFRSLK